jgi:hypothetical protein
VCCTLIGPQARADEQDFTLFLAQGYHQLARVAARGHSPLSAYFKQRSSAAAGGEVLEPLQPVAGALDPADLEDAIAAREQLLASFHTGTRDTQPLLAAIAQINFDCWMKPLPKKKGIPSGAECRRRFSMAFGGLQAGQRHGPSAAVEIMQTVAVRGKDAPSRALPAGPLPSATITVDAGTVPVLRAATPASPLPVLEMAAIPYDVPLLRPTFGSDAQMTALAWQGSSSLFASMASPCGSGCSAPDFVGPAADGLIVSLKSGGEAGGAGGLASAQNAGGASSAAAGAGTGNGAGTARANAVGASANSSGAPGSSGAGNSGSSTGSDGSGSGDGSGSDGSSGSGQGSGGSGGDAPGNSGHGHGKGHGHGHGGD